MSLSVDMVVITLVSLSSEANCGGGGGGSSGGNGGVGWPSTGSLVFRGSSFLAMTFLFGGILLRVAPVLSMVWELSWR